MRLILTLLIHMGLSVVAATVSAEDQPGPIAEWRFDEGRGEVTRDDTGNGHDAALHGATWVQQGSGFALELDGEDDYIDGTALGPLKIAGPIAMEAWVKPTRKGDGEAMLMGEGAGSFALTYYNTELAFFYIGAGHNHLKEYLTLNEWQHLAASFDGERMTMWLNGRQVGGAVSKFKTYATGGTFIIGAKDAAGRPQFKGLIDHVRVYDRPLTDEQVVAHVRQEAADHGLTVTSFSDSGGHEAIEFFKSHPNEIDLEERGNRILIANNRIGLAFTKSDRGFQIDRLYGIEESHDYLAPGDPVGFNDLFDIRMTPDLRGSGRDERWKTKGSLMGIIDEMATDAFSVESNEAKSVSWRREVSDGQATLHLNWHQIPVRGNTHLMDVEVTVTLRADDPMSYWRINITNPGTQFGIERVRFPLLSFKPIGDPADDVYIYPREHGGLIEDPFNAPTGFGHSFNTRGAYYPVDFNMQFQALYDKPTGKGIYLATQDSTPHLVHMKIVNTPQQIAWEPAHFPPNITFAEEDYALPYDCVVGPFKGDWYDAAQIYRSWAIKQNWCRKGPLRTREDVPKWYKESPFMFYTVIADSAEGTHSLPDNMDIASDHFREFLEWADMPLPAVWYCWKQYVPGKTTYNVPFGSHRLYHQGRWQGMPPMNIHDGNYPQIGALEAFTEQTRELRAEGGMVCPYVALEIFDQGPSENSPYATEARPNMVRDLFGVYRTWGNETAWQACPSTDWWQQRLEDTCSLMVQREHVGGFYLDVMQGSGLPCYWTPHGHSAAGGDSSTTGMHQLVERCYAAAKAQDSETIITGENSTENMIDVIDGTLQVTLWPENKAHIFATVYQDYVKRYGTELSTGLGYQNRFADTFDGDAFFMECAFLFVQGAQIGRIRLRPRDAALSLENPEQAPMIAFLEQVLGYYKQDRSRDFLSYGQFMRPLAFDSPSPMPTMAYGDTAFPALWSGVFRNADGDLCVFIVNPSRDDITFNITIDPARHGAPKGVAVNASRVLFDGSSEAIHRDHYGDIPLAGSIRARNIIMYDLEIVAPQ